MQKSEAAHVDFLEILSDHAFAHFTCRLKSWPCIVVLTNFTDFTSKEAISPEGEILVLINLAPLVHRASLPHLCKILETLTHLLLEFIIHQLINNYLLGLLSPKLLDQTPAGQPIDVNLLELFLQAIDYAVEEWISGVNHIAYLVYAPWRALCLEQFIHAYTWRWIIVDASSWLRRTLLLCCRSYQHLMNLMIVIHIIQEGFLVRRKYTSRLSLRLTFWNVHFHPVQLCIQVLLFCRLIMHFHQYRVLLWNHRVHGISQFG